MSPLPLPPRPLPPPPLPPRPRPLPLRPLPPPPLAGAMVGRSEHVQGKFGGGKRDAFVFLQGLVLQRSKEGVAPWTRPNTSEHAGEPLLRSRAHARLGRCRRRARRLPQAHQPRALATSVQPAQHAPPMRARNAHAHPHKQGRERDRRRQLAEHARAHAVRREDADALHHPAVDGLRPCPALCETDTRVGERCA